MLQYLWLKFALSFIGNIVCDGVVAGSLTYYLRSYRTGMPRFIATCGQWRFPADFSTLIARTEPVVQQLILLSTSTGLLLW